MPVYVYKCDSCDHDLEVVQPMSAKPKRKCPACGRHRLYRVPQAPYIAVRGSDRETLGTYAEKNTKKVGREKVEKFNEDKKPKDTPWWRKGRRINKKLAKATPEQQTAYIERGVNP